MPLINCEINLILTWFENYFLVTGTVANKVSTFAITAAKFYGTVVTLSTQDNGKLLQQLQSCFKRTIN